MRQPGEPTVEEILESIKQVMARDTGAVPAGEPAPSEPADGEPGEWAAGVLDLAPQRRIAPADDAGGRLISDSASNGMRGSLDALAALSAAPRAAPASGSGDASPFEAMVRELLRPALAAWLDRHLPPLVERLVAAEIARIVGQRR